MNDEIKLGELAFTGEEIFKTLRQGRGEVIPGEIDRNDLLALRLNDILREKLTRTTKIFGRKFRNMENEEDWCFDTDHDHGDTHAARLICIGEINQQMENKNK